MSQVEFIGGPYDGYRDDLGANRPAEELAWLVCRDVFRLFTEQKCKGRGTITSIAIYELEVADGQFQYRFVRAISSRDLADDVLVRQAMSDGTH